MSHKPDPVEALHAAVLTSSLKMSGAAKAIGRSPGVLYNKFCDSALNELTAREALALSDAIGGTEYAEAVCAYFGGVFIRLPDGMAGQDDVLGAYLQIIERMGELSRELTEARANGVIEPDEFVRLTIKGNATAAAIMSLLAELQTMVTAPTLAEPIPLRGVGSR